ncbi:MAG: hypothetical protein H0A75_03295 [Candidatus Methanofishera endochildressiae]|uniref:Uncharacterized protein n=1 Tax=Candidatus Methanofishera endochildressiae TaxID=2738884 RepID=A0A7Z0MNP7_9GAMM|nr:hypothetical protein [Candidatus Methanofishera endochildressiae]
MYQSTANGFLEKKPAGGIDPVGSQKRKYRQHLGIMQMGEESNAPKRTFFSPALREEKRKLFEPKKQQSSALLMCSFL